MLGARRGRAGGERERGGGEAVDLHGAIQAGETRAGEAGTGARWRYPVFRASMTAGGTVDDRREVGAQPWIAAAGGNRWRGREPLATLGTSQPAARDGQRAPIESGPP